ncbi:MAG: restriction endonuclease subunit S [Methylobacter sp.]|nr:restriction endonuclease subunit S [Methylobacter sp.]
MSDWHQHALRDISTHIKDGTHGTHKRVESGVPFLSAKNVGNNGRLNWDERDDFVSELDYSAITSSFSPRQGDVLLTVVGSIGRAALFDGSKVTFQRSVAFIRCTDNVLPSYLYQAILSSDFTRQLERRSNVTAQAGLYLGELAKCQILLPPNKQQKKIACILQTIDQAIEKTEALIEKHQHIKAGLMHDLFTRGIGADGKLRPPREQAPELYQQTPIGWIPKEWSYDRLENMLAQVANNLRSGPFGSALLKSELVEGGIPFLGIDNIHIERFDNNFRRFVSEKKYNELIKYAVRPRDVVITIMGTVGRSAVIPDHIDKALSSKHLWTMTLNQNAVVPELVCWQLNYSAWVKAWFRKETQGGIMDAIQSKTLRTMILPIPPIDEQQLIFDKFKTATSNIETEKNSLEKLQKQKSGLMHDLLTGKVSVQVAESEPEIA